MLNNQNNQNENNCSNIRPITAMPESSVKRRYVGRFQQQHNLSRCQHWIRIQRIKLRGNVFKIKRSISNSRTSESIRASIRFRYLCGGLNLWRCTQPYGLGPKPNYSARLQSTQQRNDNSRRNNVSRLTVIAVALFIWPLLYSCVKPNNTTFVIKEGNHNSVRLFAPAHDLDFSAKFDHSAVYDPDPEGDLNKLLGFSCGDHHDNSARFGWRWNDSLEIHAYMYFSGQRYTEYITSIDFEWHDYELRTNDTAYVFVIDTITRYYNFDKSGVGYMLFPYFGGDDPAPHDVTIMVR